MKIEVSFIILLKFKYFLNLVMKESLGNPCFDISELFCNVESVEYVEPKMSHPNPFPIFPTACQLVQRKKRKVPLLLNAKLNWRIWKMWRGLVVGEKYDKFLYSIYPQNIVSNWKTFSLSLGNASEERSFQIFLLLKKISSANIFLCNWTSKVLWHSLSLHWICICNN